MWTSLNKFFKFFSIDLKFLWIKRNFHEVSLEFFGNFPQNLPEIFIFCNSYEFHSQNFYILPKNFINNYYIYKIYPTISTDHNCCKVCTYECRKIWVSGAVKNCIITFWCISRKQIVCSYRIPNSRMTGETILSTCTKFRRISVTRIQEKRQVSLPLKFACSIMKTVEYKHNLEKKKTVLHNPPFSMGPRQRVLQRSQN